MLVKQVQELIQKKFIGRNNVTPQSKLKADLCFDDWDIITLLIFLEQKFAIKLPESVCQADEDISVSQIAAIVENAQMKRYTMGPQIRAVKHDCK